MLAQFHPDEKVSTSKTIPRMMVQIHDLCCSILILSMRLWGFFPGWYHQWMMSLGCNGLEQVEGAGKSNPEDGPQEANHPEKNWSFVWEPEFGCMGDTEEDQSNSEPIQSAAGSSIEFQKSQENQGNGHILSKVLLGLHGRMRGQ